jgi:ubiquinone/menaquinone biosynthesis C-methylase UbiE
MTLGQRFARLVTNVVVRVPALWRVFRRPLTRMFDGLAPQWDERMTPERLAPLAAALAAPPAPPHHVLDCGTGSGAAARLVAARFPSAEVTGVDASPKMIDEARRRAGGDRERYEVADAAALPFPEASFDLVTLNNMIPFFDELARVTTPGGHLVVASSLGDGTPIWVPLDRVQAELERRGFVHVANFSAGSGVALVARKQ